MSKIFIVLYISLFIVNIIDSYEMKDKPPVEDVKLSKHRHHKIKSTLKDSEVTIKKTNSDGIESNKGATEKPSDDVNEQGAEEKNNHDKSSHTEQPTPNNTTDENFGRTGESEDYIADTDFLSSLAKTLNTSSSDSDDYSETNESEKEDIKIERSYVNLDQLEHNTESAEVLLYTPIRKSLSQDAVLDLKARNGRIESEEQDTDIYPSDINVSKDNVEDMHDSDLRSGYVPPDYNDVVMKPSEHKQVNVNPYKWPNGVYSSDLISQYSQPNNAKPETMHYDLSNSPQKYSALYFNSINSREMLYPNPNSHEYMWGQSNAAGPLRNTVKSPYFGLIYPNSQLYYPRTHDRCPTCQGRGSSRERNFRRSAEVESSTFKTANGRTMDFDPLEGNSYPYVPHQDLREVHRNQDVTLTSREQLPNRNVQPSDLADHEPLSKILMPSYVSRSTPKLLNRIIGLGGLHRIILK